MPDIEGDDKAARAYYIRLLPLYTMETMEVHVTVNVPIFVLNHLPESLIKSSALSLPYKQPGPVLTLFYIAVGHPQQAPLWWV